MKEAEGAEFYFAVGPQSAIFHYRDLALFKISEGKEIAISPTKGANPRLLGNAILGTPMGILLLQRGFLVLHAGSVDIDGKIACFLGASGMGKSTTVCSLVSVGHKLVTDDVVAIDTSSLSYPKVIPGYPSMKVGDEVISSLGLNMDYIEKLGEFEQKVKYNIRAENFSEVSSGKLACIYFLEWADHFSIVKMNAHESLMSLVKYEYGYAPRNAYPVDEQKRFLRSAEFVKTTPCFSLHRPRDISKLNTLASMIEQHIHSF